MNGKMKKRGFVMTGGGVKGLYEAGVIHAFHITGKEFDVITGSSVGAMNSIFYAEYLFRKKHLPENVRQDPLSAVQAMDPLVMAYHHAWLQMPDKQIIDDSEQGAIGKIKNDLEQFDLSLPLIARLAWWWTDPDRSAVPPLSVWPALVRLLLALVNRLGGPNELLRIFKYHRDSPVKEIARTYLSRFGIEHALVPMDQDHRLKDIFTLPVSPLKIEHLQGDANPPGAPGADGMVLVDPARNLRDYAQVGITVRMTRANYRTGRLEISGYLPPENFTRWLEKQAWRIKAYGPEKIPLGSFRLQVPGNPNAVNAAICSGRLPGVFAPYPFENIYPRGDPENTLLYQMLDGWLGSPPVQAALTQARQHLMKDGDVASWEKLYAGWAGDETMRKFFPLDSDVYIDGGSIDNTPSNSAVDYVKEWVEEHGLSKRDVSLDLFVIFLGVEPKIDFADVKDSIVYQVVDRTLKIMGTAKNMADANTVQTINAFGQRAENLATALKSTLDGLEGVLVGLGAPEKEALEKSLFEGAKTILPRAYLGDDSSGIVNRMEQWVVDVLANGLPLQVDTVKIYPVEMPLDTVQFTLRLGYRKENAIKMLTLGCSDTLWTLRNHLEQLPGERDPQDQQVLDMARKWMGPGDWPTSPADQADYMLKWACTRTECIYHAQYCAHGRAQTNPSGGN